MGKQLCSTLSFGLPAPRAGRLERHYGFCAGPPLQTAELVYFKLGVRSGNCRVERSQETCRFVFCFILHPSYIAHGTSALFSSMLLRRISNVQFCLPSRLHRAATAFGLDALLLSFRYGTASLSSLPFIIPHLSLHPHFDLFARCPTDQLRRTRPPDSCLPPSSR